MSDTITLHELYQHEQRLAFFYDLCHSYENPPVVDPLDAKLIVIGTGAGIVLAQMDRIGTAFPDLPVCYVELSGKLSFEQRCILIDYAAHTLPTLAILWNGLYSGFNYPCWLREVRNFCPPLPLAVYTPGIERDRAESYWQRLGVRVMARLEQTSEMIEALLT